MLGVLASDHPDLEDAPCLVDIIALFLEVLTPGMMSHSSASGCWQVL